MNNTTLTDDFLSACNEEIARLHSQIDPSHIKSTASAGSVIVDSVISPPAGVDVHAVASSISASKAALATNLQGSIHAIPGMRSVATFPVTATVSEPFVVVPATAAPTAAPTKAPTSAPTHEGNQPTQLAVKSETADEEDDGPDVGLIIGLILLISAFLGVTIGLVLYYKLIARCRYKFRKMPQEEIPLHAPVPGNAGNADELASQVPMPMFVDEVQHNMWQEIHPEPPAVPTPLPVRPDSNAPDEPKVDQNQAMPSFWKTERNLQVQELASQVAAANPDLETDNLPVIGEGGLGEFSPQIDGGGNKEANCGVWPFARSWF